ncbi:MAG TPA: fused MFS/spermidine synthase [Micropepsaceae bacterium]|jgi:spermidine synthase|nr:fused MFS/spermidine synthase [Micropepsaceae bacterium]
MRAHAVVLALLLALTGIVPAQAQPKLLHQERSLYRNIFVTQDGDELCMLFRYPRPAGRESCKLLHDPGKLIFDYTQMMLAGLYLNPNPKRILITGEGGGTIPTALQEMFPDAQIDLVELDKSVDSVARNYFGFKPGPKVKVTIADGRVFVKRAIAQKPNYDLVLLDAFDADYIPEHMLTREFLQEVKSVMAPNGVIVANTFSNSALYDYESVTYRAVFGPFFNLKLANRIIVGRPNGVTPDDLAKARTNAMMLEPEFAKRGSGSNFLLPLLKTDIDWNPNTRILTDQYSPSNLLNAMRRPEP